MSYKTKILYFDLETTGVDKWNCAIHQLSGIIEIDGVEKERLDLRMKPFQGAKISEEALALADLTEEKLNAYPLSQADGYRKLVEAVTRYVDKFDKKDKLYLAGFNNASFDNDFLRNLFSRNNDKYFGSLFWSCPIDVMILAGHKLMSRRPEMKDFKLATVAREFGANFTDDRLHEAMFDVELTKHIYDQLQKS